MESQSEKIIFVDVWKYIFLCFGSVILSCSLKNYLIYLLFITSSFQSLWPSILSYRSLSSPGFLQWLFNFQNWIIQVGQNSFNLLLNDRINLFSCLIIAPFLEEALYRGPLLVIIKFVNYHVWWLLAVFLSILFSLSHNLTGLSLLPLSTLGLSSSWLIIKTKCFWPSLMLHIMYNFYVMSYPLYQSMFWGD